MGLRLNTRVVECLKAKPGVRFTARDIAQWIMENYPGESAEKLASSKRLSTEADLMQQIVAEIGANRPTIEKKWNAVRTTAERPRKYFWSEFSDEAIAEAAESADEVGSISEVDARGETESDLYPKLVRYLSSEWGLFAKRIDEKTASNRRGPQGNRWLFPDLVAMEDLTTDLSGAVRDLHSISGARKFRVWAFEVKLVLNRSNVRESFFQTVSNSSWANFGYLVASEIQSDETLKELQILCSLHGTGLIQLNSGNPDESEIRIPARERQDIDWANANRLASENRDFMSVVELLKEFHQTGKAKRNEWD
ncbi:MAG TPA: HrgA protein [Novosphingobium sp.]|nr:HrgA protein [Novosphingobium sp.]